MSTINERIQKLVNEVAKGNASEFERSCNLKKDTLKHVLGGRLSKPSYDTLECIARTNVRLNSGWLLTGNGEMFEADKENKSLEIESLNNKILELEKDNDRLITENNTLREVIGLNAKKEHHSEKSA